MEQVYQIRDMVEADWEEVSRIYAQGIASGIATFQTEIPTYIQWNEHHSIVGRLVIHIEESVVGWCALSPISSRAVYRGVGEVSIYIDELHRGKGLGNILLKKLCETSEHAGFWMLQSSIIEENQASLKLHQQCGFRVVGFREKIAKDCHGIWRTTILLERRMSSDYKEEL